MNPMNNLSYLLQHTATILYRQSDQVMQERLGIGMSQFKILMHLHEKPNVQQRMLADLLGQTEASISRQIKILTEKGMLTAEVNPENKREHITTLTPRGVRLTRAAQDMLEEYQRPSFEQLSEKEREQFMEMLHKVHVSVCGPRKPITCDQPFNF
jgi:DNA-binding MarR family transcriptional regulator